MGHDRLTGSNIYFSFLYEITSILALFRCLSSFSSAGSSWLLSLFLASFPSFSFFPTPIDRVSSSRCLKARHEADSFEPAEWSERLASRRAGWLGAAAVGSIPALVTFFSFSSLLLLFLSSLSKTYISPFFTKLLLSWRFSAAFLLSLALVRPGCSLFLASFPSFSLFLTPIDRVSSSRCLKAGPP